MTDFPQKWKTAVRRLYWTRKKAVIRDLVTTVSQLLFFTVFLVLGYGILYECSSGALRSFLDSSRALVLCWQKFAAILFAGAPGQWEKLLRLVLFLYGVPFMASLTAALMVGLLYHPLRPKLPDGETEQAKQLWVVANQVRAAREKKRSGVFGFCAMFFAMICAGAVAFFYLYIVKTGQPGESRIWVLHVVLGAVGSLVGYGLLNLPLRLLVLPLYASRVPQSFYDEADACYRQARNRKEAQDP